MRAQNPWYARSEYHTQLENMSFDKIFELTDGVYYFCRIFTCTAFGLFTLFPCGTSQLQGDWSLSCDTRTWFCELMTTTTTTTTAAAQHQALEPTADTCCIGASTSEMELDYYTGTTSNTIDCVLPLLPSVCRRMARRIDFQTFSEAIC